MRKIIPSLFLLFIVNNLFSDEFYRIIEVKDIRMYGSDIEKLQIKLIEYGFNEIGEIDAYYGPLTENAIKTIQFYLGFEQNGKVDVILWDLLFNESNAIILKNINIISKYDPDEFEKESGRRMGYSTEGGHIEKYFLNKEIKMIKLDIYGETFQIHYNFYYINSDYYFIVVENNRYPFPIYYLNLDPKKLEAWELERYEYELEIIANGEFWEKTTNEYEIYLNENNNLFQLINGKFVKTDFNLEKLIEIIEDKSSNWH
jgi:peptidoglycan hydrolase-like protein with peptidoglycan-binding domain